LRAHYSSFVYGNSRLKRRFLPAGLWPLLAAGFVSSAGDSLHQVAIMWLIYELTGSATATGLVGMSQYLPAVLISPLAGALVDRLNRKQVMILADGVRAVLVALIPILYLSGHMTGLLLGVIAFSIALFTTVFMPARDAIVPQIVKSEELTEAGSVLQTSYGFAYFLGPMIAAAILPLVKIHGLFFVDSLSYAASLAFLLYLRPRPMVARRDQPSPWELLKEGLKYAHARGLIRGLLWLTAVDNLFIMGPALVGTPLYVRLHLGLGAGAYAATQGAFAAGMVVGSLLVKNYGKRWPRGKILLWALVWDALTFVPFYFLNTLTPVVALWFVHSIGIPFILVPRTTLIQTEVPGELQGRMFSLVHLTVVGLSAISCALTGILAEVLPVELLYAIIGIAAAVVGAAGWMIRDLREAK
jgi:MFS transporter, DHA3 family, macrolide efflux protein